MGIQIDHDVNGIQTGNRYTDSIQEYKYTDICLITAQLVYRYTDRATSIQVYRYTLYRLNMRPEGWLQLIQH